MMIPARHPKYIDPFTEYGFKILFGQERHKHLLISLLNALLRGRKVITDLVYLDKDQLGLSPGSRKSVFDVYCKDENGDRFVVEIQRKLLLYFAHRAIFYSAYPIIEQGVKGEWNHQLKEMCHIWIMDHTIPDSPADKKVHEIKLMDVETGKVFDNSLTYLFIEAPKFTQQESELATPLDEWMYVLTNLTKLQEIPVTLRDNPIFKDFFMVAELLQMTHEEREAYLVSLKEKWDEYSLKETAMVMGKAEGKAEGIEEGIAIGMQKGEAIGMLKSKMNFARELKKNNESITNMIKYTGLTAEQIEQL